MALSNAVPAMPVDASCVVDPGSGSRVGVFMQRRREVVVASRGAALSIGALGSRQGHGWRANRTVDGRRMVDWDWGGNCIGSKKRMGKAKTASPTMRCDQEVVIPTSKHVQGPQAGLVLRVPGPYTRVRVRRRSRAPRFLLFVHFRQIRDVIVIPKSGWPRHGRRSRTCPHHTVERRT
jgi:hypothetical protein